VNAGLLTENQISGIRIIEGEFSVADDGAGDDDGDDAE
jgi:hypothetical protein